MRDRLAELLQAVTDSSDNQYFPNIAELIYRICKGENYKFSGSELLRFVQQNHERCMPKQEAVTTEGFVDRRILDLSVKNFRGFSTVRNQVACGIRIHHNDKPMSLFMVGSNGSGKSSLFCALESLYSGHITTKQMMNISDEDNYEIHDFGKQQQIGRDAVEIMARYADGGFETMKIGQQRETMICPPAAFCSDYDIDQVSHHKQDLTPFILSQNGYGRIYDFHQQLLSDCIEDLDNMISSRQDELNRYKAVDFSKAELLIVYSTLTVLSQGIWRAISFTYYIEELDEILDVLNTTKEAVLAIDFGKQDEAMVESIRIVNQLIGNYRKIRERQTNVTAFFTFQNSWDTLMKKLQSEENRLRDDTIGIIGDLQKGNREIITDEPLRKQVVSLKKALSLSKEGYDRFKDDESQWPIVQKEILQQLAILQTYEDSDVKIDSYVTTIAELKESLTLFKDELKHQIARLIDSFISDQGESIDYALSWLAEENGNGEKFHIHKDPTSGYPVVIIRYKRGNDVIETYPSLYLNTFRFRIFVVILKIALAFSFMKTEKVLIPIAIDEVFNSSDFEKRLQLEEYVNIIYNLYNEMKISKSRLQLILFTHDEVVLRSFVRGAKLTKDFYATNVIPKDYIQGRLFNQKESEKLSALDERNGDMIYHNLYKAYL